MENTAVEAIIANEQEWRRHIMKKTEDILKEQRRQSGFLERLRVWLWVWRSAGIAVLGYVVYVLQHSA